MQQIHTKHQSSKAVIPDGFNKINSSKTLEKDCLDMNTFALIWCSINGSGEDSNLTKKCCYKKCCSMFEKECIKNSFHVENIVKLVKESQDTLQDKIWEVGEKIPRM